MSQLKDRITKFDRLMAAVTFAEAGERETALEIILQKVKTIKEKWIGSRISRKEPTRPDMRI